MSECRVCHKKPEDIPGWDRDAAIEGQTLEEYAEDDGTYDRTTDTFMCDDCYIKAGMPLNFRDVLI